MLFKDAVKNFFNEVDDKRVYDKIFYNYLKQIGCNGEKCDKFLQSRKLVHFFIRMHKRQNKIKKTNDEFWATVFHDMKSPMMAINFALKERKNNDEILTDIYNLNLENLNFIQGFLDVYQLEYGFYFTKSEIVDLKKTLVKLAHAYKYFLIEKNLKINLDNFENDLCVTYSKTGILRLFSNLISNAIKFANNNSEIIIEGKMSTIKKGTLNKLLNSRAADKNNSILISVRNYGKKIKKGMENAIFDKFEKTKNGKNLGYSSGLGLYICKKIIKQANGEIWAENLKDGVKINIILKI